MAYGNLGFAYLQKEEFDKAVEACSRSIELAPGFVQAYDCMAVAHLRAGRIRESIAASEKALEVNPSHAIAHVNLAGAYAAVGDTDKSAEHTRLAEAAGYSAGE
jgi:tetratricopeptide (TPR) repeat protein